MSRSPRRLIPWRLLQAATVAIPLATTLGWATAQTPNPTRSGLAQAFDAAWARQPEAQALAARRDAAEAHRRASRAWTPEPAAAEFSTRTDRLTRNEGAREYEAGIAVPLWLPGERGRSAELAEAEAQAVDSRAEAARLRLAAALREQWWHWQRARLDAELAREQRDSAQQIAADVARRVKAGELARADQHQADGALAAAESAVAQADAALAGAALALQASTGMALNGEPQAGAAPEPEPRADEAAAALATHPALRELDDRGRVAAGAAALATTQRRANPELTFAATVDRGAFGERYAQTLTLGLRLPFGAGPRHEARVAAARAEAAEVEAQRALEQTQLQAGREAARQRVDAARAVLAATERRARLAAESRGFFDKSFRLGETDLPTRLRIEAEALAAEREAGRARVELAAAISDWRQALGLLPQ